MKNSESPEDDSNNYNTEEFDPCLHFSQFLEEARHHTTQSNFKSTSVCPQDIGNRRLHTQKKSKKSWKNIVFSWLKGDKKRNPSVRQETNAHSTRKRWGQVSGPIYGHVKETDRRHQRSASGYLAGHRSLEIGIPYMCLDQLNNPNTYGPVYVVT